MFLFMLNSNPKERLTLHSQLSFWKKSRNNEFLIWKELRELTEKITLKLEIKKKKIKYFSLGDSGKKNL